jgi:metallo-beta-lactamase family protein
MHEVGFKTIEDLEQWIKKTCIKRGGKLIIPAFSVGRTQEILYWLNQLELEHRLPEVSYFVDSPLGTKATEVIKSYKNDYNDRLQNILKIDEDPFLFKGLKYVETADDSKQLVEYKEPCVIISSSGTADAGRVKHHIYSCIDQESNSVLMSGYCQSTSLGGRLLNGARQVEIFGDTCNVKAEVGQIKSMSAHADTDDLCRFVGNQDTDTVKTIFLVHGEYLVQQELAARLNRKGFQKIEMPSMHQEFDLQ